MPNLPDQLLSRFSELVASETGLHFPRERWPDLERGVRSVASDVGAIDAETYLQQILSKPLAREEIEVLASALTVGETYFFREKRSFEILSERVLPPLIAARQANEQQLRIWSAGCCTGEEPFSIAIWLDRLLTEPSQWHITILGTDINPRFLQKAAVGIFSDWSFRYLCVSESGRRRLSFAFEQQQWDGSDFLPQCVDVFFAGAGEGRH